MADRGRKAHPVSSPVLDEWWTKHCAKLHKERLRGIKPVVDMDAPASLQHTPSQAKKVQQKQQRQAEVDHANQLLLDKLIRIKSFDSSKVFKPWLARSTFQYGNGVYVDHSSGVKCVDHRNLTAGLSPRSIHSPLNRPGTAPSLRATQAYLQVVDQNSKLLRTIEATSSVYQLEKLQAEAMQHAAHSRRLSNYRGPEWARYTPSASSPHQSLVDPYAHSQGLRPSSAQIAGMGQAPTRQYAPLQRRSVSAPRKPHSATYNAAAEYGWSLQEQPEAGATVTTVQPSGAGAFGSTHLLAGARHAAELAELGVVEEGEDGEEDTFDMAAMPEATLARNSNSRLSRGSGSGSLRPTSANRLSTTAGSGGLTFPTPTWATGSATLSPPGLTAQDASPPGSARLSRQSSVRSSGAAASTAAATSPYLQPVSSQQAARTGSASGSRAASEVASSRASSRPASARFSNTANLAGVAAAPAAPVSRSNSARSSQAGRLSAQRSEHLNAPGTMEAQRSWASSAHSAGSHQHAAAQEASVPEQEASQAPRSEAEPSLAASAAEQEPSQVSQAEQEPSQVSQAEEGMASQASAASADEAARSEVAAEEDEEGQEAGDGGVDGSAAASGASGEELVEEAASSEQGSAAERDEEQQEEEVQQPQQQLEQEHQSEDKAASELAASADEESNGQAQSADGDATADGGSAVEEQQQEELPGQDEELPSGLSHDDGSSEVAGSGTAVDEGAEEEHAADAASEASEGSAEQPEQADEQPEEDEDEEEEHGLEGAEEEPEQDGEASMQEEAAGDDDEGADQEDEELPPDLPDGGEDDDSS